MGMPIIDATDPHTDTETSFNSEIRTPLIELNGIEK